MSCLGLKESAITSHEAVITKQPIVSFDVPLVTQITSSCYTLVRAHCSFVSREGLSLTHPVGTQWWKRLH